MNKPAIAGSGQLTTVSQTVNAAGQTVRQVRDRNGGLYRVITDAAGRIVTSARL